MKILSASLCVFSMFFGAGNLIYPIFVGTQSLDAFGYGILGLSMSGILLPLLGLVSISLYNCNIDRFFSFIGKKPGVALVFLMLIIMGPIGAIPRCILVSYGSFTSVFEGLNVNYFSALFCIVSGLLASNKAKLVEIIAKWLTPILVIGISTIIIVGFLTTGQFEVYMGSRLDVVTMSIKEGYCTMDMCAAFFFAKIVLDYLRSEFESEENAIKNSIFSSVFGMLILFFVYACLIFIGAKHGQSLQEVSRPYLLTKLTYNLFGSWSGIISCITITMACLTTVIALNELVAEWFAKKLKISLNSSLFVISILSFASSVVGFEGIAMILASILKFLYPALIFLTLANLISYFYPKIQKFTLVAFWLFVVISPMLF